MQCEPDMHIEDFLRKIFFSFIFSMVFVGLLTGFLVGCLTWVVSKKTQRIFWVKVGSPNPASNDLTSRWIFSILVYFLKHFQINHNKPPNNIDNNWCL
jgi:hypothetical protein